MLYREITDPNHFEKAYGGGYEFIVLGEEGPKKLSFQLNQFQEILVGGKPNFAHLGVNINHYREGGLDLLQFSPTNFSGREASDSKNFELTAVRARSLVTPGASKTALFSEVKSEIFFLLVMGRDRFHFALEFEPSFEVIPANSVRVSQKFIDWKNEILGIKG